MPLTLEQPAAGEAVEAAAPEVAPEDEESVAARLAALGLVAGGAAAAGAAGVSGIADAAERALEHDDGRRGRGGSVGPRALDFRPSPAPASTPVEAEPTVPWPASDLGAPTEATVEAAPEAEAELEAPADADAAAFEDAAAATLVVETVEVVPDQETGALLVEAEAEAIVEAIPEAEAELEPQPEPAPEIIPLPTTVVAATVDVGANSAHLLVAAVTGHLVEPLLDESAFLGLGDRVATHGYLGADARDELVATLAGYADAARSLGASSVTFVGTEPVRRAADAAPLIHAVEGRANAPLHVLDHDEEAKLMLLGVTGGKPVDSELLVIDIGGGSSQFVIVGPDRAVDRHGDPARRARA